MLYGYACPSYDDRCCATQRSALIAAGCADIFEEYGSSPQVRARLALGRALDACARGDVLIVARLDRLGRSPAHAVEIIANLTGRGIAVRALAEQIDTGTAEAAVAVRLILALAAFEHATKAHHLWQRLSPTGGGPIRPRPHGRPPRRPRAITREQIERGRALVAAGDTIIATARVLGVNYNTLRRYLAEKVPAVSRATRTRTGQQ